MLPPPIVTAALPEPSACTAVVLPYPVVRPFATPVTTVGGGQADVVNVASDPAVVPFAFVAIARKWYRVPHVSALTLPPPIGTAEVPDPSVCVGVAPPYAVVRPYSKLAV